VPGVRKGAPSAAHWRADRRVLRARCCDPAQPSGGLRRCLRRDVHQCRALRGRGEDAGSECIGRFQRHLVSVRPDGLGEDTLHRRSQCARHQRRGHVASDDAAHICCSRERSSTRVQHEHRVRPSVHGANLRPACRASCRTSPRLNGHAEHVSSAVLGAAAAARVGSGRQRRCRGARGAAAPRGQDQGCVRARGATGGARHRRRGARSPSHRWFPPGLCIHQHECRLVAVALHRKAHNRKAKCAPHSPRNSARMRGPPSNPLHGGLLSDSAPIPLRSPFAFGQQSPHRHH
jgi:hypothetical protein